MRLTPEALAARATRALRLELNTWPKPGLVSPIDCGSHQDMDAALLTRSALSLEPYFAQLAAAGAVEAGMSRLRQIGLAAETAMLAATGGVNAHRGAIFGLGLLCAAAGTRHRAHLGMSLGSIVKSRWGDAIGEPSADERTHGAGVWRRYGIAGARSEAGSGFAHLYQVAWPALKVGRQLADGDEEAARVHCLFALMASLDDTNLLHRGGPEGLLYARSLAADFMQRGGVGHDDWRASAVNAHRCMVARRLSPGGSADLLAMTLFVDAIEAPATCSQPSQAARVALV